MMPPFRSSGSGLLANDPRGIVAEAAGQCPRVALWQRLGHRRSGPVRFGQGGTMDRAMRSTLTRRRLLESAAWGGAAAGALAGPRFSIRSAGAQSVELNWAVSNWAATEVSLVEQVANNFEALHQGWTVNVLGYDPNTYDQKLLADIAAGTLPDIFVNADVYTKPFFDAGLTADLKVYADQTGFDLASFDPKFLDLATYDGKVGFLPRAADVVVLYFNKRLFDEAGLAHPTEEWTWTDLLAASEQLTKTAEDGTTVQYGFTANYTWWAFWVPLVVAEGGQILNEDNTEAVFDSPEGIRAWDVIFSGIKNGWFVPPSVQQTMGGEYIPFSNGSCAMTATIRGLTPSFRETLTDDWDVILMPKGTADRKSGMGTMGYAMSAQSENPDAAWELLQYTYTEGMKVFMETYLLVPPIQSFYDDPTWKSLPGPPYNNDTFVKALDFAMLPPPLPFYSTGPFRKAMEDGLQAVILDQMTTEQAVQRMAEEGTRSLRQR
jgi:multiple sugar transport system substrate-binding protein